MPKRNVKQKDWLLSGHVASGSLWFGVALAMVLMTISNRETSNGDELHAVNAMVKLLDDFVIIPMAVASALTGTLLCWLTVWGFFKSYWIIIKWIVTTALILLAHFGVVSQELVKDKRSVSAALPSLSNNSKDCFNKLGLRDNIFLFNAIDLSFSHPIHCLDPAQRFSGTVERLESHHWFYNSLDISMVLLNDVIQILALPSLTLFCDRLISLQGFHCHWVSRILVHVNHLWSLSVLRLEHFTKEAGCCLAIALRTQPEVKGIALGIDCSVQVLPHALDFDVSLVHSPRTIRWLQVRSNALVEFRGVLQDPTIDCRVVYLHAPLLHHLLLNPGRIRRSANTTAHSAG
jgi:hypothetical protein